MNKELTAIKDYSFQKLSNEKSGHDFFHSQRVAKIAKKIAVKESANQELVVAAGYLHDVIDDKVALDSVAEKKAIEQLLHSLGWNKEKINELFMIIENISFSKELESGKKTLTLEGEIVQDADRIDALGAIGIMRTAYYGGAHQNILYDPAIKPRDLTSKKMYRDENTVINHFYEKLLKLPALMNTDTGKKEARRRKEFMENFLMEFYHEWENEKE